jgi:hypothetical protein
MEVKKYLGDIIRQCECRRWLIHWEKSGQVFFLGSKLI